MDSFGSLDNSAYFDLSNNVVLFHRGNTLTKSIRKFEEILTLPLPRSKLAVVMLNVLSGIDFEIPTDLDGRQV